jgi:hypothetical protein
MYARGRSCWCLRAKLITLSSALSVCNKDGPLDNFQFPYQNKRERSPSVSDSVIEQHIICGGMNVLHVLLQKWKVGSQRHTENILKFMCHGSILLVMGKFRTNSVTIFFLEYEIRGNEVLAIRSMSITILLDVTPCDLIEFWILIIKYHFSFSCWPKIDCFRGVALAMSYSRISKRCHALSALKRPRNKIKITQHYACQRRKL